MRRRWGESDATPDGGSCLNRLKCKHMAQHLNIVDGARKDRSPCSTQIPSSTPSPSQRARINLNMCLLVYSTRTHTSDWLIILRPLCDHAATTLRPFCERFATISRPTLLDQHFDPHLDPHLTRPTSRPTSRPTYQPTSLYVETYVLGLRCFKLRGSYSECE